MTAPLHPLRVSVVGLGNVFLGDDGFGPLAIEQFRCRYECDGEVEILDLGAPGLDLAPYLDGRDLIVVVDAVQADNPPGTLSLYSENDFLSQHARVRVTGHDPGLLDSLAHLRLADRAPSELVIIGAVPQSCNFGDGISQALLGGASAAADSIARLLSERGVGCRRREAVLAQNLWWLPTAYA
jgi:hydrogenase maturation protease